MGRLKGQVAVVTGASRGAGRGIAAVLGEEGATVYVTGRSTRERSTEPLPGSVEETAALVTERGGVGIPVRVDHAADQEVEALFARVRDEQGRLDILVNNVWGGYVGYDGQTWADGAGFGDPFWRHPMARWDAMVGTGPRAHLAASRFAVPLMLERGRGLIVLTTAWDREKYLGNVYYDVAKAAVNRLAFAMAQDLRPHGIAAVALAPGFMRTERVVAAGVDLSETHSPEYVGRAVAALAADPDVMAKTGRVLTAGELAAEYGFTDVDGRYIPPFRIEP